MEAINRLTNQSLRAAFELRKSLQIGMSDPLSALDVATRLGVDIRFMDCPSLEGMYLRDLRPRIFLPHSGHRPRGRILVSCAHELGHHQLGHGTSTDEYLHDDAVRKDSPEEVAADTFACHLLMPRQVVANSFERRGFDFHNPTDLQCFVVSQELGVGFATLIHQMSYGLRMISFETARHLRKSKPAEIRKNVWEPSRTSDLFIVDEAWKASICDVCVDDFLILPVTSVISGRLLQEVRKSAIVSNAIVYRVSTQGRDCIKLQSGTSIEIRTSAKGFVGRYVNSYVEEPTE